MNTAQIAGILLAFFALTALTSAVSTQCGLLNVGYLDSETITQGGQGGFTFTVYNSGESTQRITTSAVCDSRQLECSFTGVGSSTLISPGQTLQLSLDVHSTGSAGQYNIPVELRGGVSAATCTANLPLTLQVNNREVNVPIVPLTASIDPSDSVNARPGEAVEYTLTLHNNLNKRIFASITSKGTNPFESTTSFSSSSVSLQAGETKEVSVTVRLPPGTPGGRFSWIYYIDSGICCGYNITLPVQEIRVEGPILDIDLIDAPLRDECTVVNAGERQVFDMALRNNGDLTGPFDISVSGSATATGTIAVSQSLVEINKGESVPVTLAISPSLRTPVASYFYNLRGTYQGFNFLNRQFCFSVKAVESARLELPRLVVIQRSRLSQTTFNVTNNGSTADEYAITPFQHSSLSIQPQPASFRLTPGQTQEVTLAITSTLATRLGERSINLTLDGQNYSRKIELNATVAATGAVGESLIAITVEREIYAAQGKGKTIEVAVQNTGQEVLSEIAIEIEGLQPADYSSETATLLPGETGFLAVTFTLPTGASQVQVNLTARSGREFAKVPVTLIASQTAGLEFTVREIIENRNSNGETESIDLVVTVQNTGSGTATSITALMQDLDYVYTQRPQEFNLEPGQTLDIGINVKPADRNVQGKNLTLQFTSGEGTTQPQSITLPSLTVQSTSFTWKIVAVLILLIGILLLLAKKDSY